MKISHNTKNPVLKIFFFEGQCEREGNIDLQETLESTAEESSSI